MKLYLLLTLPAALVISCAGDWNDLLALQEELRCGMSPDEVGQVALGHGFSVGDGSLDNGGSTLTARREDDLDQLVLFFAANSLESAQKYRHTGFTRLCEFPVDNLCTREQRVRVTIEHSRELEGHRLLVDSEAHGTLSGGAVDLYLTPGEHRIEVLRPDGRPLAKEIDVELPKTCHELNPRVEFI